jgi:hypothetical protein
LTRAAYWNVEKMVSQPGNAIVVSSPSLSARRNGAPGAALSGTL